MKDTDVMNNTRIKPTGVWLLNRVLIAIYCFLVIARPTIIEYNTILFSVFLVWLLFSFLEHPQVIIRILTNKVILSVYAFSFFIFLTTIISPESSIKDALKYSAYTFMLFTPYIIFLFVDAIYSKKQKKRMFFLFLSIWFIIALFALVFYQQEYNAARRLASNITYYGITFVGGGYCLAYSSSVFAIYLIGIQSNNRRYLFKNNLIFFIFLFLLAVVVIETQSTITTLIMVFGLLLAFILRDNDSSMMNRKRTETLEIFVLLAVLVIIIIAYSSQIGDLLVSLNYDKDAIINSRLRDIGYFLKDSNTGNNSLTTRLELISYSLKTFFSNPLLGVGYLYGYEPSSAYQYGVGGHSELADSMAKYGIIGSALFIFIFMMYSKESLRKKRLKIGTRAKPISIAMIIVIMLMFVFNPYGVIQGYFVLFLVIPLIEAEEKGVEYNDQR